jgi:hypothetical protein
MIIWFIINMIIIIMYYYVLHVLNPNTNLVMNKLLKFKKNFYF